MYCTFPAALRPAIIPRQPESSQDSICRSCSLTNNLFKISFEKAALRAKKDRCALTPSTFFLLCSSLCRRQRVRWPIQALFSYDSAFKLFYSCVTVHLNSYTCTSLIRVLSVYKDLLFSFASNIVPEVILKFFKKRKRTKSKNVFKFLVAGLLSSFI